VVVAQVVLEVVLERQLAVLAIEMVRLVVFMVEVVEVLDQLVLDAEVLEDMVQSALSGPEQLVNSHQLV